MEINEIRVGYNVSEEIAKYLSNVTQSKDFKDYENHKRNLQRLCDSDRDLNVARKVLVDIMEI